MRKKITAAAITLIMVLMTGCGFSMSIDNLIAPPKLTVEQEHIYNALKSYTGPNISLKYPKSGDYLSAFTIADIDGDSSSEAIVFYEKNTSPSEESILRMNILDCIDGQWKSVYDHIAEGSEVEKIIITKLGDNSRTNIIVGYSLINQSEKVVSIYHYENGTLSTTFENNYYSLFETTDLNDNGTKDLFIALSQSPSRDACVQLYHLNDNGEYEKSSVIFEGEGYTDYQKISYGILDNGKKGIYLDAVVGGSAIVTSIFALDENNALTRVFAPDDKKSETLRPAAYTCSDADGDGIIEIPVPKPLPGYSPDDENALYLTKWYTLENEKLSVKMCGYLSITNGYSFIFPENWLGNVSAYADAEKSRITYVSYTGQSPEEGTPLLTVRAVSESDTKEVDLLMDVGYEILHSRGDRLFLIDINKNDDMIYSPEEIMFRFKFLD